MNYCANCGFEIIHPVNFCPKCGAEQNPKLTNDEKIKAPKDLKNCENCGEINPSNQEYCIYCGIKFSGNEVIYRQEMTNSQFPQNRTDVKNKLQKQRSKKQIKSFTNHTKQNAGKIDGWKIYSIILTVAFIGFLILFISTDIFKSSGESITEQPVTQDRQTDLSGLNEINKLEKQLQNDPKNPDLLLSLANKSHDAGFFEKAINVYSEYLKLKPNDFDAKVDMGVCYFELKSLDKAEEIFQQVIKQNNQHQIALLNLGVVNLSKGKVNKAKEFLNRCIAINPSNNIGIRAKELLTSH